MGRPKPLAAHVRAFVASSAFLVFALGFSWAVPFASFECARGEGRTGCVVQERLLGVVPARTVSVSEPRSARLWLDEGQPGTGGKARTRDAYFVILTAADGNETRVMSSRDVVVVDEINGFLADPEAMAYSGWTVPPLGYAPILPALLGLLFISLVGWDVVSSRLLSTKEDGPGS
jgi:hypothetical protein